LKGYPDLLSSFDQLWWEGKFRQAYLCVDKAIRGFGLVLTAEERKVDEAFYWEVVN
jgi:hypothetical protein